MTSGYSKRFDQENLDSLARGTQLSPSNSQKAIPFKVCLIGNSSVGKTCIVERYVNNKFSANSAITLAAAFNAKTLEVNPNGLPTTRVKLQLWDTAGSEEYRSINQLYYKKAAVILLVYSVTDYESFDGLAYWHGEVAQNADPECIKFVVGAKIDDDDIEEGEAVPKQVGQEYAKKINAHFFLTSAKENIGINRMFQQAAEMCAQNQELRNDLDVSHSTQASDSKALFLPHFSSYNISVHFYLSVENVEERQYIRGRGEVDGQKF